MRTTFLLSTLALAVTANIASAENYHSEIHFSSGKSETEFDSYFGADKTNHNLISGTYYFDGVSTRNHPLAEAAFLERSSNISLTHSRDRTRFRDDLVVDLPNGDVDFLGEARFSSTLAVTTVDVEFYIPNSIFYVGGGISEGKSRTRYSTIDAPYETGSYTYNPGSFWSARVGVTPVQGLLVWSEFFKDQELSDEWNINAKYVMDWSGNALNLEGSYDYFYGYDSLSLAADFYFDRTFSVGVTYDYHEGDLWDDAYGLRARKFFTDKVAVEASYAKADNGDFYNVGVSLRF